MGLLNFVRVGMEGAEGTRLKGLHILGKVVSVTVLIFKLLNNTSSSFSSIILMSKFSFFIISSFKCKRFTSSRTGSM